MGTAYLVRQAFPFAPGKVEDDMSESSGRELRDVEKLATPARGSVREFAGALQAAFGEDLLSTTVHGAAVLPDAEFAAEQSPVHTAVVVQRFDLEKLRTLAGQGRRQSVHGIAAPAVLTPDFIAQSRDTFALELIEIQQQHVTVLGEDPFAALTFEEARVARQCERELKVILAGMHHRLLEAGGQERNLPAVYMASAEHLCRAIRGLLWLKGRRGSMSRRQIVETAREALGQKLAGIEQALHPKPYEGWATFRALYDDVAALGAVADGI